MLASINCFIGEIKPVIELSQALLTPVLAIFGVWFAWRQVKTNRSRLKLDLFDKRYELFSAAGEVILIVLTEGSLRLIENEDHRNALVRFRNAYATNRYLVNKDAQDFFKELDKKVTDLRIVSNQIVRLSGRGDLDEGPQERLDGLLDRESELLGYFADVLDNMEAVMADDLKIEH